MATQLLIYGDVKPVTKTNHQNLYVKTGGNYSFAENVNSVPLMAVEFPQAFAEYPIVFAGDEKKVTPVVVMGVNEKQNLFVKKDEGWDAKYIPAFIRRYPFVFSSTDDGKTLTLCIDESFEGCNQEGRGERLFDNDGERTQYLENTLKFLENYQAHHLRTNMFCEQLVELELLQPMQAQFTAGKANGEPRTLSGFMGINREKLKELSDENVLKLFKNDSLELIYQHLLSMRNFSTMAEKLAVSIDNKPVDKAVDVDQKVSKSVSKTKTADKPVDTGKTDDKVH